MKQVSDLSSNIQIKTRQRCSCFLALKLAIGKKKINVTVNKPIQMLLVTAKQSNHSPYQLPDIYYKP